MIYTLTYAEMREISDYYLTHSVVETQDAFERQIYLSNESLTTIFKIVYGQSKKEWLSKKQFRYVSDAMVQKVANYYQNHSVAETEQVFPKLNHALIEHCYVQVFHETKKNSQPRRHAIAKHYLTHLAKETAAVFNIPAAETVYAFKQVYGMTKSEYIKNHVQGTLA